jgi:hypothetical protein
MFPFQAAATAINQRVMNILGLKYGCSLYTLKIIIGTIINMLKKTVRIAYSVLALFGSVIATLMRNGNQVNFCSKFFLIIRVALWYPLCGVWIPPVIPPRW